jgi:hypothetical protein
MKNKLKDIKILLNNQFTEKVTDRFFKKGWVTEDKDKSFNLLSYIKKYIRKEIQNIFNLSFTDKEKLNSKKLNLISDFKKISFIEKLKDNIISDEDKNKLVDCLNKVREFILLDNAIMYKYKLPNGAEKTGFYDMKTKADYFEVLNNIKEKDDNQVVKDNYFFNIYLDPEGLGKENHILLDEGLKWTQNSSSGFDLNTRLRKSIEALRDNPKKTWFKEESEFYKTTANNGSSKIIIKIDEYIEKIINIVNSELPSKLQKIQTIVDDSNKSEEKKTEDIFLELGLDMTSSGKDVDMTSSDKDVVNKNFLRLLNNVLNEQEIKLSKLEDYKSLIKSCKEAFDNLDYTLRVTFLETSRNDFIRDKKQNLGMKSDQEFAYMGIKFLKSTIRNPAEITDSTRKMTAAELESQRRLFGDLQQFEQKPDEGYPNWKKKQQASQRNRRRSQGGVRGPHTFAGGPHLFAGGANLFAGGANPFANVKKG